MATSGIKLRLAALAPALLCLLLIGGCGDAVSDAAGTYVLDKENIKAALQADIEAEGGEPDPMAVAMATGMVESMQMTLTLRADGTATSDATMMGQKQQATGKWTISGDTITLSLAEEGAEPEAVTATLNGDTLEMQAPDADMPVNLIFKRQ